LKLEELSGAPVLIFCNKRDKPSPMSMNELTEKFASLFEDENNRNDVRLEEGNKKESESEHIFSKPTRSWFLQESVATTGEGLHEGLEWLSVTMAI
jgi:hypothetical protein